MNLKTGGILGGIIAVVVVLIIVFTAFPILWPMATSASTNVTAMTGTDAGTTTMKSFIPVVLLLIGLGLAISLIVFAIKSFSGGSSIGAFLLPALLLTGKAGIFDAFAEAIKASIFRLLGWQ